MIEKQIKNELFLFPGNLEEKEYFVYTNRNNLLIFLASGYIIPRNLNNKYYSDLSTRFENGIIIFSKRVSYKFLSLIMEDQTSYPVCIKINLPEEYKKEKIQPGELNNTELEVEKIYNGFITFPGILSLGNIKSISFYDENSLKEFTSRIFDDVRLDNFTINFSNESFGDYEPGNFLDNSIRIDFPQIKNIQYSLINRLLAAYSVIERSAIKSPSEFLSLQLTYLSIFFEDFSPGTIKKIEKFIEKKIVPGFKIELPENWIYYLPFYLVNKKEITSGFNNFILKAKLQNLSDESFIRLFLCFCIVDTLINMDEENIDSQTYMKYFINQFDKIKNSKKITGADFINELENIYKLSFEYIDSLISFSELNNFPAVLKDLKLFLIFIKNFHFDKIYLIKNNLREYNLTIQEFQELLIFSAIWSGYRSMPSLYKEHLDISWKAFDFLTNSINGKKIIKKSGTRMNANFTRESKDSYEGEIIEVKNFYGFSIRYEVKNYYTEIYDLIIKSYKPVNDSLLKRLAEILKIENVIVYIAEIDKKNLIDSQEKNNKYLIRSKSPFLLSEKIDYERLVNKLKNLYKAKDFRDIPLSLKKSIKEAYIISSENN